MREEGRLTDAIEMLEFAAKSPPYVLKAQAQLGLCHRSLGDFGTAIQIFRAILSDPSATRKDVIDVQYFLAQTLESVGQMDEAATLYSRVAQLNPLFKDAARRAKELTPMPKRPVNGKREIMRHGSWLGNVIESFNHLIGSRK